MQQYNYDYGNASNGQLKCLIIDPFGRPNLPNLSKLCPFLHPISCEVFTGVKGTDDTFCFVSIMEGRFNGFFLIRLLLMVDLS